MLNVPIYILSSCFYKTLTYALFILSSVPLLSNNIIYCVSSNVLYYCSAVVFFTFFVCFQYIIFTRKLIIRMFITTITLEKFIQNQDLLVCASLIMATSRLFSAISFSCISCNFRQKYFRNFSKAFVVIAQSFLLLQVVFLGYFLRNSYCYLDTSFLLRVK